MSSSNQQQLLEQQQRDRELIVRVYALYRLLIASALLAVTQLPALTSLLGMEPQPWLSLSAALYLATAILTAVVVFRHFATQESSTHLMLWSDLLLLPLIMIYAGNFATSLGLLLALSFFLGSLSLQHGYIVRALAATTLLAAAHWLSQHFSTGATLSLSNSAAMGLFYLMIGLLSSKLARHLSLTEKIVLKQRLSLDNQIDVNAFIIQQLHSGAVVVDNKHRIQYGNEAAWRMLGKRPGEEQSQLTSISAQLESMLQQWISSTTNLLQESTRMEFRHGTAARFCGFGPEGQGGILITLEDQSEITKQAQQMKLASLGQLTAGVAHEIRNPLSSIQQAAQLLGDSSQQDSQQVRLVEIIQRNTRRINRLVEEVLQMSRRAPNREVLQLNQWLPPMIDGYRSSSLSSSASLLLEFPNAPCRINFDAEQLRQVLVNVITNAQQHSKPTEGELTISVRIDCPGTGNITNIDVSDNGAPIPQQQHEQLFDPFFTTHNSGTGLGLYLSRELCLNNYANLEFIAMENGNCFRIIGESGMM